MSCKLPCKMPGWAMSLLVLSLLLQSCLAKVTQQTSNDFAKPLPDFSATPIAVRTYMKSLFLRYNNQSSGFKSREGNTVRSVIPKTDSYMRWNQLSFKLDSFEFDEVIHRAEIHMREALHRRFEVRRRRKSDAKKKQQQHKRRINRPQTRLYCYIAGSHYADLRHIKPASRHGPWIYFDIQRELSNALENNETRLGLTCGHISTRRGYKALPAKRLQRIHEPFLISFSTAKIAEEKKVFEKRVKRSLDAAPPIRTFADRLRVTQAALEPTYPPFGSTSVTRRRNRSRKRKKGRKLPVEWYKGYPEQPERASYFGGYSIADQRDDQPTVVLLGGEHESPGLPPVCVRNSLPVKFRDIGWSDWIIQPSGFDAGFCQGGCSLELGQSSPAARRALSNHAVIQSVARATLSAPADTPAPTCAPSRMDSLTLLFYDRFENVVLRNYPDMIVKSCACL